MRGSDKQGGIQMITTLYKRRDGQSLTVTGHFTKQEIAALKSDGYRLDNPSVNKHGIKIA